MGTNTFKKSERLSSKKLIKELFQKGSSFYLYPFKTLYLRAHESSSEHQIIISVPKRIFKRAVDRNIVKRRIREAYRLNKHLIAELNPMLIGYIYSAKEILDYHSIEKKLKSVLLRLHKDNLEVNDE